MNIFRFINVKIFILSLFIGMFAVYIFMPDMKTIRVYPTPENVSILQYKDSTDTCFTMKQTEVNCPSSESDISKIPLQS